MKDPFASARPGDVGIIGDPVEHSLSPAMHAPALEAWWKSLGGAEASAPRYHLFHVKQENLAEALEQVRSRGLRGVNITVPHKEPVCAHLNGLIGFAGSARSVNTVANRGGQLLGYNTDAEGFVRALKEDFGLHPNGRTALVLGAGGTGAVLIRKLLDEGARRVFYWNRSAGRGVDGGDAADRLRRLSAVEEINGEMDGIDLVVNATSVGLKKGDPLPIEGLRFRKEQFVYDVVYHRETELLGAARKAQAKTAGGLSMLLYQGALAFEIWTGAAAPLELMRKGLKKI